MTINPTNDDMTTTRPRRRGLIATAAATAAATVVALFAGAQLATAAPGPPEVPGDIAVPAGNVLSSMGAARGFQIYTCQSQGTGYSWVLSQPMAVLLREGHKPMALHYGGPSWTAMDDGSTVTGARVNGVPAPSPDAIPWLLLKATPTGGPEGGTFTDTTFIQRVNTTGGLAPATGCDASHVGATARIPYTADYYFFRAG